MDLFEWIALAYGTHASIGVIAWVLGFRAGARERKPKLDATDIALHAEANRGEWLCDLDRARARKMGLNKQ